MAICPNDTITLVGRQATLELADGCPDVLPSEAEWKYAGALTSKSFDFSPNTVTSESDRSGGFQESLVTNSDFTISAEGEVRTNDRSDEYGFGRMVLNYATELGGRRQPTLWVRLGFGPVTMTMYATITALSGDAGTNDIVTFSAEFHPAASDTVTIEETV